jgi:elongator complex protein 2
MMASVTRDYVAASVNRYPSVCDWGEELIAFGSCHSVCVYNIKLRKIVEVLMKHTGDVRTVRWIFPDESLVSCAVSQDIVIWKKTGECFQVVHHLTDFSSALFVADTILVNSSKDLLTVSGDTDSKLSLFLNHEKKHELQLKHFAFDAKLITAPPDFSQSLLVVFASDDCMLHLGFIDPTTFIIDSLIDFPGHDDWIRSIDSIFKDGSLFIASASQDNFVRITKITRTAVGSKAEINKKIFNHRDNWFEASLETVLAGHEAPVYAVRYINPNYVMTASLDKSVVIWKDNGKDEVWTEVARVGEIGGNNMGFFGCCFPSSSKQSGELLSHFSGYSYNGSLHFWEKSKSGVWDSLTGMSGHNQEVTDLSWDPEGNYLLSVSNDETTRLHAKCQTQQGYSWHEIARPQIHGYLINCITCIDHLTFASGSDEKVIRVFQATKSFVQSERLLTNYKMLDTSAEDKLPMGSMVPSLGLTNRAVYETEEIITELNGGDAAALPDLNEMREFPQEEVLMQSTLWPEIHKLYGHGNELFAIGCSNDRKFLASACKATKSDQASIIVWDISQDFKLHQTLLGHSLTVTSVKFSPCNSFLVTCSRDRTWILYQRKGDYFKEVALTNKSNCLHARIIWEVCWGPTSKGFLTVSRDKKAILWSITVTQDKVIVEPLKEHILTLDHAIMSCDILDSFTASKKLLCAFGLEDGSVLLYTYCSIDSWIPVKFIGDANLLKHHLSVRKVRFCRTSQTVGESNSSIRLASCSEDRSVHVYIVTL